MEHTQRYIFLAMAVVWSLFRLLRYMRAAGTKRPGPAIPPSGSATTADVATAPPSVQSSAAVQSPIAPAGGSQLPGILAAAGIFIVGNAVIWPLLFFLPGFEEVPTLPRLVVGVLANLVLVRLAGGVAARLGRGSQPHSGDERNPIK